MPPTSEAVEPARRFIRRLRRRIRIQEAYLFGSRACMIEPREDADWDFIIVSPDFERVRWLRRGEGFYGLFQPGLVDVDFVCLTPAEFDWQRAHATIIADAMTYAVRLDR